jgi:hypothetical protein
VIDDLYPTHTIAAGLAALTRRWPQVQSGSAEEPVFVLSAGWRSGSTLVQRALMSQCLIWGEPLGQAGLIERLADPLRTVSDRWPEPHFVYRGQRIDTLQEKFVANLYPPPQHWLAAHLAWFDALFAQPARAAGKPRWGLKEVRLSADHAAYLRWLYPRAKFIFLIRNPYAAFRSFAARRDQGWRWYHRWPSHPVTPELFGRHWRELTESFLAAGEALGGFVVQYEDLKTGGWEELREYVGFELSDTAMRSNPPDGGPPPLAALTAADLEPLRAEVEPLAAELGYEEGSGTQRVPGVEGSEVGGQRSEVRSRESGAGDQVSPSLRPSVSPSACPPAKCAILVPVAERIEPECEQALRELERRGYRVSRVSGYKQIDLGRNQMASDALAAGCEETLWIDADTGFHPDAIEQLRSHDLPIVCGIYPKKNKRELAIHALPGTKEIVFGKGGGLIEILYGPTGFLRIRREVYETLRRRLALPECLADTGRTLVPYFAPLIRPDGDSQWYLADDFAFCERARQCGYKIVADTTIRLWHIGTRQFGWEDAGANLPRFGTYRFQLSDDKQTDRP